MANSIKKNHMAQTSFVGAIIIGFFLLLVGTVKVIYKVVRALFLWHAEKESAKSPRGIETTIHRVNGGNLVAVPIATGANRLDVNAPEFADTIPVAPVETELRISSRIHIAQLMQGDVRIGRIWFYTYDKAGKIRRVFKVDDRQVRKFMGTERFYMTDVDWDPAKGEQGIETIKKAAFNEVMSLMMSRLKRSGGTKKQLGGNVELVAKEAAPAAVTPKAPPAPAPVQAIAPAQAAAAVATANVVETKPVAKLDARPAKGDKFAGVIAEMGRVKRPGGRDGQGYFAYCLKLDQNGKHTTHYGVEIERELLERNCAPGDTVELTYMGRQMIDDTTHKNLFKIDVIRRQNGQKGAN